jgi:hypothetical protein
MDLDDLMITWCCDGVQAVLAGGRLRKRGPQPHLSESEVLTMEVVGAYLGIPHDIGLFRYFQEHHVTLFPHIRHHHLCPTGSQHLSPR